MSKAINSFIAETKIAKSKKIYMIGETAFIRTLLGLEDIASL